MCVAVPMRVESVNREDNTAACSMDGSRFTVDVSFVPAEPGDHVLVHAGCALQILPPEEADLMRELFAQIEGYREDAVRRQGESGGPGGRT